MIHSLFRRYQQVIMVSISVATIISFVAFYSGREYVDKSGSGGRIGMIYGRPVSQTQFLHDSRKADLCMQLAQMEMFQPRAQQGLIELFQSLAMMSRQEAKDNFIWNSVVLKHEAENLGLEPTEDEIFDALKSMSVFQTNGAYDSQKYATIIQNITGPLGLSESDLHDLIANSIRLKKVKALLGATVAPSTAEIRDAFTQINQKTEASVIRFKFDDFLASTQVPDEDVKKLYEERKSTLKTDEQRKVKFVALTLPAAEKPLQGHERVEELTKLKDLAEKFAADMAAKDAKFDEVAGQLKLKVQETPDFTIVKPPAELDSSSDVAAAAFKLNQQEPNSDVVETPKGYFVMQLVAISPPRPLTYDEAKANLNDTLKRERAQEALNLKATDVRNKMDADLKAGKTFAVAAEAAGVKPEVVPPFSQKDPGAAREFMAAVTDLKDGQLSSVVPSAGGSVIVYVAKRLPIDEKELTADKGNMTEGIGNFQQMVLFQEWLKLRRAAAQLQTSTHAT